MHSHGGNGGPGILPAVTLLEKGSHLSGRDLKVLVVNSVLRSQILRRKFDLNY